MRPGDLAIKLEIVGIGHRAAALFLGLDQAIFNAVGLGIADSLFLAVELLEGDLQKSRQLELANNNHLVAH